MKYIATIFLSLSLTVAFPQSFEKEINNQIWKPFIKAFQEYNAEAFLAVHSKDLVRSPRDSKILLNWNEYLVQQKQNTERSKTNESHRTIELRFTERIANASQAIEIGFYKTTVTSKKAETNAFFGRFIVVSRKENGTWKILVDTDSTEGGTVTEKDFLAAQAME